MDQARRDEIWHEETMAIINQRRRQLHVHSVLYYHFDTSLISDHLFDTWAMSLVRLQEMHPESLTQGYMPELFQDWTGDTGMHLPVDDRNEALAKELIRISSEHHHQYPDELRQ